MSHTLERGYLRVNILWGLISLHELLTPNVSTFNINILWIIYFLTVNNELRISCILENLKYLNQQQSHFPWLMEMAWMKPQNFEVDYSYNFKTLSFFSWMNLRSPVHSKLNWMHPTNNKLIYRMTGNEHFNPFAFIQKLLHFVSGFVLAKLLFPVFTIYLHIMWARWNEHEPKFMFLTATNS